MAGPSRRFAWLAGGERTVRCDFVRDWRALRPAFSVPHRLPWQELPRCELMEFQLLLCRKLCTSIRHELRHARKAWPVTLEHPCLLSVWLTFTYPYSIFKLSGWQGKINFVIYYFRFIFHFMKLFFTVVCSFPNVAFISTLYGIYPSCSLCSPLFFFLVVFHECCGSFTTDYLGTFPIYSSRFPWIFNKFPFFKVNFWYAHVFSKSVLFLLLQWKFFWQGILPQFFWYSFK
jgi:hypothetical protein